jgi:hypothetical protein
VLAGLGADRAMPTGAGAGVDVVGEHLAGQPGDRGDGTVSLSSSPAGGPQRPVRHPNDRVGDRGALVGGGREE